jgi:MFS family permease
MAIQESSDSTSIESSKRPKIFHGWYVLAASCFVMGFSSGVNNYGATVFFNPVSEALGLSAFLTSAAISLARTENFILAPLIGYFIDKFGPRGPVLVGMTIMGLGLIMFGLFANNLLMFIVTWTFMVSLGANIGGFAPNWTAINNWFDRKKGRAMGIGMTSQSLGGVVLAPVLAFIISRWGWETGAIVTGIAVFLLVIPISRFIRTRPQDMGLLPDGDPPKPVSTADASGANVSSAVAGIAQTVNFSIGQARRTKAFWVLMGALGLRQMGQAGMQLHMSPMLQERYGFGAVEAGFLIGLLAVTGAIGGISIGIIGDHFPRRRVMGIVVGLEALSIFLVVLNVFWFVYIFLILFGFGQGVHALNRAMLGEYFGNSHYARLWGILSSATTPLAAAGPIYAGWLADSLGYGAVVFTFMFFYAFSAILYWNCRRPSLPNASASEEPALPQQPNAG